MDLSHKEKLTKDGKCIKLTQSSLVNYSALTGAGNRAARNSDSSRSPACSPVSYFLSFALQTFVFMLKNAYGKDGKAKCVRMDRFIS